jgi:hypothetical protein
VNCVLGDVEKKEDLGNSYRLIGYACIIGEKRNMIFINSMHKKASNQSHY